MMKAVRKIGKRIVEITLLWGMIAYLLFLLLKHLVFGIYGAPSDSIKDKLKREKEQKLVTP